MRRHESVICQVTSLTEITSHLACLMSGPVVHHRDSSAKHVLYMLQIYIPYQPIGCVSFELPHMIPGITACTPIPPGNIACPTCTALFNHLGRVKPLRSIRGWLPHVGEISLRWWHRRIGYWPLDFPGDWGDGEEDQQREDVVEAVGFYQVTG